MFAKKLKCTIRGTVVVDKRTKNLVKRIRPGQIAIIDHEDIDEMGARDLIAANVKAVINASPSITGSHFSMGAKLLLHYKVPLFDCSNSNVMELSEGSWVEITDDYSLSYQGVTFALKAVTESEVEEKLANANETLQDRLALFIQNTLTYAQREKDDYIHPLPSVPIRTKVVRRHVLIVVRGKHYREDLQAIRSYIKDYCPVLIGVDGGADALLEEGWQPDIIIGDMDSVTDQALRSGAEIIVHAYPNGQAPAKSRMDQLGVPYFTLPATGTSEDVAMLYCFEQGAEWIVAVGAHSNMVDFLEKGRKGMASTVLVRMKVGTKLIDARGVSMLYQKKIRKKNLVLFGSIAVFLLVAGNYLSTPIKEILHLIW